MLMQPLTSTPVKLVGFEDMPPWFQAVNGPNIRCGYRPTQRSLRFYVFSLFFVHNEFLNAWSHLFGSLLFLLSIAFAENPVDAHMLTYHLAAAACFLASTMYHLFMPMGAAAFVRLSRVDYAGIFVLIGSSAIPYYAVQFACHPHLQLAAVLSTAGATLVLTWLMATQAWFAKESSQGRIVRVTVFSAFGTLCAAFGGTSIFLGFSPTPYFQSDPSLLTNLSITTVLFVLAPVAYAARWPEKRYPGTFDYVGASHQIMHIIILAAALLNGWCMERVRQLQPLVQTCTDDD